MLASFIPGCDSTPELKSSPAQPLLAASTQLSAPRPPASMTLRRSRPCSRLQSKRWPLPPRPLSSRYLSTWWSVRAGKVSPTLSAFPDADVVREGVAQRVDIGLGLHHRAAARRPAPEPARGRPPPPAAHCGRRRRTAAAQRRSPLWPRASFTARGEVGTKISPP